MNTNDVFRLVQILAQGITKWIRVKSLTPILFWLSWVVGDDSGDRENFFIGEENATEATRGGKIKKSASFNKPFCFHRVVKETSAVDLVWRKTEFIMDDFSDSFAAYRKMRIKTNTAEDFVDVLIMSAVFILDDDSMTVMRSFFRFIFDLIQLWFQKNDFFRIKNITNSIK